MSEENELIFKENNYRDYTDVAEAVKEHYRKMRIYQTAEYVQRMKKKYLTFDKPMLIWDALEKLDDLIDVSDPDINLPNVQHLIQSAEAMRRDNRPDWMQLVGLIHDLGKVMYLWGCDEDGTSQNEQWGLVGDIFVVGAKLPDTLVYSEFNSLNPDEQNPKYNTDLGMYEKNCGLDNLHLAWGHDEYMYQVLMNHPENKIPKAGMVMLRFHSFYPWHSKGSYTQFLAPGDEKYKEWVNDFNLYDLYTKVDVSQDFNELKAYYQPIIEKYLGSGPINW